MFYCFSSEKFFVSEVLVILSSCLFVVMALLTAVVSVTNTTFGEDPNMIKDDSNCPLPHVYCTSERFDFPFIDQLYIDNHVINAFNLLLVSSLRNFSIKTKKIGKEHFFPIIIGKSMRNVDNSSLSSMITLKEFLATQKTINGFKNMANADYDIQFKVLSMNSLHSVEDIQRELIKNAQPIILSLPIPVFHTGYYFQTRFGELLLPSSPNLQAESSFLVIGYNSDYIAHSSIKGASRGGFIAKSVSPGMLGHSLMYLTGEYSEIEELQLCGPVDWQKNQRIKCINISCCDLNVSYYIIDNNSTHPLLKVNDIPVYFENITSESLHRCFRDYESSEVCDYWFIPYKLLEQTLSNPHNKNPPTALSILHEWKFSSRIKEEDLIKNILTRIRSKYIYRE